MRAEEFAIEMVMEEYKDKPTDTLERLYKKAIEARKEAEKSRFVGSGGLLDAITKEEALRRLCNK